MKTLKFTKYLCSFLLSISLFIACSPEDGEDGAIGPQGPQGEQGPTGTNGQDGADGQDGAQGEQGDQGETGTANVIYSDWIDSEFPNNVNSSSVSFSIDAPLMSDAIINRGIVRVFGEGNPNPATGDTDIYSIPIVFGGALQQSHYFRIEAAELLSIVVAANEQGQNVGAPFFGRYRYVLIPGGQSADGNSGPGGIGSKTQQKSYYEMSYDEIVTLFNIKD